MKRPAGPGPNGQPAATPRVEAVAAGLPLGALLICDSELHVRWAGGEALGDVLAAGRPAGGTLAEALGEARGPDWERAGRAAVSGDAVAFDWAPRTAAGSFLVVLLPLRGPGILAGAVVLLSRIRTTDGHAGPSGAEALYRAVSRTLPDTSITAFDSRLRYRVAYGEALKLNGWTSSQIEGRTPRELLPGDQAEVLERLFRGAVDGEHGTAELPSVHGDRVLLTHVAPVPGSELVSGVAVSVDVTDLRRAESSTRRLAAIVEQSEDAIVALHADRSVEAWNRGAEHLYGFSSDDIVGKSVDRIIPPERRAQERGIARRALAGGARRHETTRLRKDGRRVDVSISLSPLRDSGGAITGTSEIARASSERPDLRASRALPRDRDPLTRLPDRTAFGEQLTRTISLARRYALPAALLLLDVDRFKVVNDTYGHAAGDAVLSSVARTLRERLRATDEVARIGGDEFAAILLGVDETQSEVLSSQLVGAMRAARIRVPTTPHPVSVTISAGLAAIEVDGTLDSQELLEHADAALYEAKEAGRDRVVRSALGRGRQPKLMARIARAAQIRAALAEGSFVLHEQPILTLATGAFERAELLLRMCRDGRLVTPPAFLPVAERFGQMPAIDEWVVTNALERAALDQRGEVRRVVHVNLSGPGLRVPGLGDRIADQIERAGLEPDRLAFEIGEAAATQSPGAARRLALRLANIGSEVVIDHFGAGAGSLVNLKRLMFDAVKVDHDLVSQAATSSVDRLALRALIDFVHALGKQVIVEWVQDDATLELVRELGADHAQGYGIARPAPPRSVE